MTSPFHFTAAGLALAIASTPAAAMACACGCGIFDTGVTSITPQASDSGLSVFLRFNSIDQNTNREQGHVASAADNADKRIVTQFYTAGVNYVIGPRWTVMAELPLVHRAFTTTGADGAGNPLIERVPLTGLGDASINLMYTGFFASRSTGVGFGVKLPTGRTSSPVDGYGNAPYDRDTLPGTGSTDVQVSAYHVAPVSGAARWFAHAQYRIAVITRDGYRPGNEFNGAAGVTYDLTVHKVPIVPVVQMIVSTRGRDRGANADPFNSGYQRVLFAPGLRVQISRKLSLYGDLEWPVAQYVNAARPADQADSSGQLVAPVSFKFQVNYGF